MASNTKHACTATCMFRCSQRRKVVNINSIIYPTLKIVWWSGCHERFIPCYLRLVVRPSQASFFFASLTRFFFSHFAASKGDTMQAASVTQHPSQKPGRTSGTRGGRGMGRGRPD